MVIVSQSIVDIYQLLLIRYHRQRLEAVERPELRLLILPHDEQVLDPYPVAPFLVDAGLIRDDHARHQRHVDKR